MSNNLIKVVVTGGYGYGSHMVELLYNTTTMLMS